MSYLGLVNLDYGHLGVLCEGAGGYQVLVVVFCSSWGCYVSVPGVIGC